MDGEYEGATEPIVGSDVGTVQQILTLAEAGFGEGIHINGEKFILPEGAIPLGEWNLPQLEEISNGNNDKPPECLRCGLAFSDPLEFAVHSCEVDEAAEDVQSSEFAAPEAEIFECTKCRLLFDDVDSLKEHQCLGYMNEAERQERKKRRMVTVGLERAAAAKAKRKLHKIVAQLDQISTEDAPDKEVEPKIQQSTPVPKEMPKKRGRPPKKNGLRLKICADPIAKIENNNEEASEVLVPRVRIKELDSIGVETSQGVEVAETEISENVDSAEFVPVEKVKKKRGRPRKVRLPGEETKKRNRKPKLKMKTEKSVQDNVVTTSENIFDGVVDEDMKTGFGKVEEDKEFTPFNNSLDNMKPLKKRRPVDPMKAVRKIHQAKLGTENVSNKPKGPWRKASRDELICRFCGKVCRKPYELRVHERQHTNERPFACPHCDRCYTSGSCLNKHIQYSHSGTNVKCKECDIKFSTKELLKEHCSTMNHTIQWPYQCDKCDKSYHKKRLLKNHMLTHTGLKPCVCLVCNASFTTKAALLQHSHIHTGDRPFECEICGNRFLTRFLLKTHKMNHTGERPHLCDLCGKGFKLAAQLRHHREVHSKDKPHACDHCGKRFKWRYNMLEHEKSHSDDQPKAPRFFCAVCGKGYFHRSGLVYHERIHTGERPYKCQRCGNTFRHNAHLQKHLAKLHNLTMNLRPLSEDPNARTFSEEEEHLKAFSCHLCTKRFKHQGTLNKHLRNYHGENLLNGSIQSGEQTTTLANIREYVTPHVEPIVSLENTDYDSIQEPEDLTSSNIQQQLNHLYTIPYASSCSTGGVQSNHTGSNGTVMRTPTLFEPAQAYDYISKMNLTASQPGMITMQPGFISPGQYTVKPLYRSTEPNHG